MRRLIALITATGAAIALLPAEAVSAAAPFAVTFVDAGQGDSAIYRGPCGDIGIIDIPDGEAGTVADHLSPFPNASVKWVAASHYHADHIGGIDDFLAVQDVDAVYDRGGDRNAYDSETYRSYHDVVTSAPDVRQTVDIGATFTLCSGADLVTFSVVSSAPDGTAINGLPVPDENDRSICLKVTHANFDLATCGDINGVDDGDRTNIETPASTAIGDVEVAKVNHHGSAYSSNQTWVNTLRAEAAIIPVGLNSFGHPDPAVVQRWTASGATVSRTDVGDVTVTYNRDTSTFTVQQGSTTKQHAVNDTTQPPPTTVPAARSIDSACTFNGGFEDGFADVPSTSPHERAIDCIVYWQVTTGVRTGIYDPANTVTRAQMASFLARFIERSGGTLPSNPPNAFSDDNGDRHEPNINKLAAVGVATGRGDGTYAPGGPVYRNQMATFIIRALEYRLGGPVNDGQPAPDYFTDDNTDNHQPAINKAAAIGITGGTGGTQYSPQLRVRRDQMASFLARGLAEIVDETDASIPAPPAKCGYDAAIERTDSRCRPCPYNSSIGVTNPNCKAPTPPPPPPPSNNCDPSYPDVCIPPPPPDLDCGDISHRRFRVVGSDPHGFDGDRDGVGCET